MPGSFFADKELLSVAMELHGIAQTKDKFELRRRWELVTDYYNQHVPQTARKTKAQLAKSGHNHGRGEEGKEYEAIK